MGLKDQELLIKINGSAKNFTDALDKARKKTKDLEKTLATTAKISGAAFVALAVAVGIATASFSKFEKEFTNVVTLLDKSSFSTKSLQQGIDDLKEGIIALGAESGENFDTLNKGLFDIISATGDAENAMGVLESATQLAIAGGTDVAVAVDGITTAIKSFGLETSDAQIIAEKFFQAQKGGKTTVEELATSLGLVSATANAFNVSLDELLAASSAATLAGIKTKATFNGLKAAFANISKPTSDAAAEAKRLGVEFDSTALRALGLEGFLNSLTEAEGFTQSSVEKLFGSVEAQNIIFALTGEQAKDFASQIRLLGDEQAAAGTFADALAVKQATVDRATARLKSSVEAILIVFGEAFAPAIIAVSNALSGAAKFLSSLNKTFVKIVAAVVGVTTVILGLTTAVLLAGLAYIKISRFVIILNSTFGIGAIATKAYTAALAFGSKALTIFRRGMILATTTVRGFAAATGIGLILIALSLLVTRFKEVKAVVAGTLAAAKVIVENVSKAMSKAFSDFVNSDTFIKLDELITPFIDSVKSAIGFVKDVFIAIGTTISDFVKKGVDLLGSFGDVLRGVFTFSLDVIKSGLAGVGDALADGFSDIGKGAGTAFTDAFNKSIAESEAAELPDIEAPDVKGGRGPDGEKDPDKSASDKLLNAERDAVDRLREIRARANEISKLQAEKASQERIEIKDTELKKIADQENKANGEAIKIKSDQLQALQNIDRLETENVKLEQKKKLDGKEQVTLEANERELATVREQLEVLNELEDSNAQLKDEKQLERDEAKLERIQEQAEEEAALNAEINELAEEERDLLDEQDIQKAQATIETKREIEKKLAEEKLQDNIKRRNKFTKDELIHGATIAKLNQFFSSNEVQLANQTAGQLVQLTQSKNSQLKAIGKAAALVQIGIKTAEGAISAFSALSGIPIVGPALGAAAAAALILFGGEQAAAVASAQRGGIVPNGAGGASDRILTFTEPGELIVPAALAPDFITAVGRPEIDTDTAGGGSTEVVIGFTDDAIPFIEQKLLERRAIGTGSL